MRLLCPFCGLRDEGEFSYEGDASVAYPPVEADAAAWHEAVYLRDQPRGRSLELWRHAHGCRALLVLDLDNATHEVHAVRFARDDLQALWAPDNPSPDAADAQDPAYARADAAGGGGGGAGA